MRKHTSNGFGEYAIGAFHRYSSASPPTTAKSCCKSTCSLHTTIHYPSCQQSKTARKEKERNRLEIRVPLIRPPHHLYCDSREERRKRERKEIVCYCYMQSSTSTVQKDSCHVPARSSSYHIQHRNLHPHLVQRYQIYIHCTTPTENNIRQSSKPYLR